MNTTKLKAPRRYVLPPFATHPWVEIKEAVPPEGEIVIAELRLPDTDEVRSEMGDEAVGRVIICAASPGNGDESPDGDWMAWPMPEIDVPGDHVIRWMRMPSSPTDPG